MTLPLIEVHQIVEFEWFGGVCIECHDTFKGNTYSVPGVLDSEYQAMLHTRTTGHTVVATIRKEKRIVPVRSGENEA